MSYERPYYNDRKMRPYLYYVVFGVSAGELTVSRERHHVDCFPEGLDFIQLKKPENEAYMNDLLGGALGNILRKANPELYERIMETRRWAVIRGEISQDSDLHYMRNAVGFVQALVESGAEGVLDLQTLSLFSSQEWTDKIFSPDFDPYAHAVILVSEGEKEGTFWLHTRGLRKFGRPDISMKQVPENETELCAQVVNQMIYYSALGAFFERPVKLHTSNGMTCVVNPVFIDDPENPDFNNSYYKISWHECVLESEE